LNGRATAAGTGVGVDLGRDMRLAEIDAVLPDDLESPRRSPLTVEPIDLALTPVRSCRRHDAESDDVVQQDERGMMNEIEAPPPQELKVVPVFPQK